MDKKIQLELLFWVFTLVATAAVLVPIYTNIPNYPFWLPNILFIITAITITRYLFLLKYTFLAKRQILKIVTIFLCIPLIFFLVQELNYFQTYIDEEGIEGMVGHLPYDGRQSVVDYMRSEYILFGTMAILSSIIFPFRLILSVWRTHNRGTV